MRRNLRRHVVPKRHLAEGVQAGWLHRLCGRPRRASTVVGQCLGRCGRRWRASCCRRPQRGPASTKRGSNSHARARRNPSRQAHEPRASAAGTPYGSSARASAANSHAVAAIGLAADERRMQAWERKRAGSTSHDVRVVSSWTQRLGEGGIAHKECQEKYSHCSGGIHCLAQRPRRSNASCVWDQRRGQVSLTAPEKVQAETSTVDIFRSIQSEAMRFRCAGEDASPTQSKLLFGRLRAPESAGCKPWSWTLQGCPLSGTHTCVLSRTLSTLPTPSTLLNVRASASRPATL